MEKTLETFKGTIMFLPDNVGSKSEAVYPFLYVRRDLYFKVLLKDDNPFENRGLVPFDGKSVEVVGAKGRRTFIIESVRALEPADEAEGKSSVGESAGVDAPSPAADSAADLTK